MATALQLESKNPLLTDEDCVPASKAFHGGKSFEAIGEHFGNLERARQIISADVLDAWFDPSPRVIQKLQQFLPFLAKTSPPVHAGGLVAAIACERNVSEECILAAGGSSDLIFACFPHLIGKRGRAMILDPMYGEYQYVLHTVLGAEVVPFALRKEDGFRIDTEEIVAEVHKQQPELIVIVNPNSPTGTHWRRSELIRFLDGVAESTTVVIDETYLEYVGSRESVEDQAASRSNVLVIKSMSKCYALSGLRVGYAVGHRLVIQRLALWIPPWAVSLPAQVAAVEALKDSKYYAEKYRQTHALRDELARRLERNARIRIYPSCANFLLIETESSAQRILERMRERNVFVRNCDSMGCRFGDRFLRLAVKQRSENNRIAEVLEAATRSVA